MWLITWHSGAVPWWCPRGQCSTRDVRSTWGQSQSSCPHSRCIHQRLAALWSPSIPTTFTPMLIQNYYRFCRYFYCRSICSSILIITTLIDDKETYSRKADQQLRVKQEVKVIWQKAPIPRLGVTPGGRKLYHWIPGVGFLISVP